MIRSKFIIVFSMVFAGVTPWATAQIQDTEASVTALAVQCAVSSGYSTASYTDYEDYARSLAKTLGLLSSSQQVNVFGYLPRASGGSFLKGDAPESGAKGDSSSTRDEVETATPSVYESGEGPLAPFNPTTNDRKPMESPDVIERTGESTSTTGVPPASGAGGGNGGGGNGGGGGIIDTFGQMIGAGEPATPVPAPIIAGEEPTSGGKTLSTVNGRQNFSDEVEAAKKAGLSWSQIQDWLKTLGDEVIGSLTE